MVTLRFVWRGRLSGWRAGRHRTRRTNRNRGWDEALLFLVLSPRVVFPARVQSSVRNHPLNPIPHPQPAPQESPHNFYKFPLYLFSQNSICVYKHRASSWQTATWRFLGCLPQGQAGRACGICSSGVARTPGRVSSSVKGSWTHRISFFFRIIMTNGFCCLSLSPSLQLLAKRLITPHPFSLGLFHFPPSFNPIFSFPVPVWSILNPLLPFLPPSFLLICHSLFLLHPSPFLIPSFPLSSELSYLGKEIYSENYRPSLWALQSRGPQGTDFNWNSKLSLIILGGTVNENTPLGGALAVCSLFFKVHTMTVLLLEKFSKQLPKRASLVAQW